MGDDPRLSTEARDALTDPESAIFVSAVGVWEIAIKVSSGKLDAPDDLLVQIEANGWRHLELTLEHGLAAGSLPAHHRDPFDRMLIAQAQSLRLTIVTRDRNIARYEVPVLRA